MSLEKRLEEQIDPSKIESRIEIHSTVDEQSAEVLIRDEEKYYETLEKRERLADMSAARGQRDQYASRTFLVIVAWISLVYLLLVGQAVIPVQYFRPFSDKVLITLLTTTTANFLGMFIIVLKYIFRVPGISSTGSTSRRRK